MVSDTAVAHVKHYRFLNTAEFEKDLRDLECNFRYISYEDIVDTKSTENKQPGTSICLTFDDGFAECISVVRPILLRHGATCIFFIVTDLIDNRSIFFETRASLCAEAILQQPIDTVEAICRDLGLQDRLQRDGDTYKNTVPVEMARQWEQFEPQRRPLLIWLLTIKPGDTAILDQLCQRLGIDVAGYASENKPYLSTEQIRQLKSDGFTIGAHSRTHRRLQDLSPAEAEIEIVESCRIIHEITGQDSVPFAFPYFGGGLNRAWLSDIRARYPFVGLFFDTQGLRRDAPFVVQRIFGERIERRGSVNQLLRLAWSRRLL
jgi:peptidoglycan/xylan/chitin deacetylase (PgdA/CDA1 family)